MLFLLHHAEAVDALIDPQRPLTAQAGATPTTLLFAPTSGASSLR